MSNSKSSETEYSLKISIRDSDDAMRRSEDKSVRMPEIEHQWREIVEKINKKNSASVIRGDILEDLIRMGQGACGEFLTPDIREKLLTTRARYLILEVDADLVHLPWELLYLNGAFLCERFSMGRIPGTYQKTPLVEPRVLNKPLDMWIVADPRGDLPEAEAEGEMLCEYMDQMNLEEPLVYADLATSVGPDDVREKIKQYDLVHFAGHATYHPERPGQSGWRLTHGNFTASDIYETAVGKAMPALVFSNACQSASTAKWERSEGKSQDEPFGLANAFMLAGTKHYLGTSWEIKDKPGSDFARSFYESLLLGNTVGESVRLARDRLKQSGNNDSWAGYVLYGDPRISYLGKTEDKDWIKLQISVGAKSHIVTSEQSPPETAPTSSSNPVTPSDTQQHSPFILNLNHYLVVSVILIGLMAGFIGYALFNSGGDNHPPKEPGCPVPPADVRKAFEEINRKKKQRIDELWRQYMKFADTPAPSADEWTSSPLTIACVYNVHIPFLNLITSVMGSQIKKTSFKLLHRRSFDAILEELIRGIETGQLRAGLKMPAYLLFIQENQCDSQPLVLMELVRTETGESIDFFYEIVKQDTPLMKQGARLSQNLLNTLKKINDVPVRGRILEIKDNQIILNIGSDHGVRIGQLFQVVDKDVLLEIGAIKGNDRNSVARVKAGDVIPEPAWKIEAIRPEQANKVL